MRHVTGVSSFTLAIVLGSAATSPAIAQDVVQSDAAAQAAPDSYDDVGGEIVVTASKRSERLQDVPGAITAIGSDKIALLGVKSFGDYVSLIPGLSQRDSGTRGAGTIILRGLNSGSGQLTNTSAYYIDDTPFTSSGFLSAGALVLPEPELTDAERIEVLKGPQGTLYGASNLGGLIHLVTKKPNTRSFAADFAVDGTTLSHGDEGYGIRGAINVPLIEDVLAIRANGFYRRTAGFADNIGTGTDNVNKSTLAGGRVAVRFVPTSRLKLDLSGLLQDIDSVGFAFENSVSGTVKPLFGKYQYSQFADLPTTIKYRIVSGSAAYDTDIGTVTASASYARYRTRLTRDATLTYGPLVATLIPADSSVLGDFSPNLRKITSEIRFASKRLGAVEFIVGGFYTDEDSRYRTYLTVLDPSGQPVPTFGTLVRTDTISKYKELAGFGNLTYYISDEFDVTGGVRYARNEQISVTAAPSAAGPATAFYVPYAATTFDFSDSSTSLLGTIRWRPSRNVSFFARAAQGYRPGGPQTNVAPPPGAQTMINPDTVWNYEAGVKAKTSDGSFSADLSVFHIDWKDIQLNSNYNGIVLLANGGDAKVDGVEAEVTARPTSRLTFAANVGYTNARISRVDPGVQTSIGVQTGDKLPLTPRFTLAMTADQTIKLGDDVEGYVGATLRYRSDMPSGYPGARLEPNVQIPDLTTVDLRAGASFGRFSMSLLAGNIFDVRGFSSSSNQRLTVTQQVPSVATLILPRNLTLTLAVSY